VSLALYVRARKAALRGPAKTVLKELAFVADDQGGKIYPAISTLAVWTGLSDRAVQKAMRQLEADGWIRIEKGAGGRARTNSYRIVMSKLPLDREETVNGVHPSEKGEQHSERVNGSDGNGEPCSPKGEQRSPDKPDRRDKPEIPELDRLDEKNLESHGKQALEAFRHYMNRKTNVHSADIWLKPIKFHSMSKTGVLSLRVETPELTYVREKFRDSIDSWLAGPGFNWYVRDLEIKPSQPEAVNRVRASAWGEVDALRTLREHERFRRAL
jgi:hypothetical protein